MAANKVLLVDDDPSIIEVLKLYFEKEGYQVVTCMQGDKAFAVFNTSKPDIIILDLMLPGTDGNDICREIRKTSDVPIIMLTARTDTLDKIIGLELGADDYIPKPFEPKEVLARVKAVLRRTERRDNPQTAPAEEEKSTDIITYPGFSVDKIRYVVTVDGNEIYMPPKELELLFFLASNPNRVFTREQLLENVWGYDFYGESRTVDVHIKRIREKIENPDREQNWCIKTVWSKGYKFETR
ncbi:MAG: response regulator transcription factor [Clostridiales bacterium]|jgi:DNA-binding response OmpR family regulator|nr:response regulator transcription factor [Clostridiales bacterium]MBQ4191627.1 response regulator transcription factor [Clostridiales bacterium]MBQ4216744.1 response regulator transcription factor [Clostridiales bacterium]MBQ5423114.1 response regulator transcription factor [Clostridiales bacterium]MBR6209886.1 response regulator transcription factor [Clostridiales bacterium]